LEKIREIARSGEALGEEDAREEVVRKIEKGRDRVSLNSDARAVS
jgi:hypothetical protein